MRQSDMPPNVHFHALDYARRGFKVLPLHGLTDDLVCRCSKGAACPHPAKHPALTKNGLSDASLDLEVIGEWFRRYPTANVAIVPSAGTFALDVDPRSHGDETLADLEQRFGRLPPTATQLTGGGGLHLWFRCDPALYIRSAAGLVGEGLDVKSSGGYLVAAPSLHASGKRYAWDSGTDIDDVADAPAWLLRIVAGRVPSVTSQPSTGGDAARSYLGAIFEAMGWLGPLLPTGRRCVRCPWHGEHTEPRSGAGSDSSCVLFPPSDSRGLGWFQCSHGHCYKRTFKDVLPLIPLNILGAATMRAHDYRCNLASP
jgi:hypothetical protein